MNSALANLRERGFVQQCTDLERLSQAMDEKPVTFYVGCDPTGKSLHIGHMVPFFAFRHLKAAGHKGLALLGGGTARIGDPSGKTEMRKMLSYEQLDANTEAIKAQLHKFLTFDGDSARPVNNRDWLANLNYIDFLREIGSHFSVNRMLSFDAYKTRLEQGLSFIEFNYQLLQSYDYLELFRLYGNTLQIGGDDQWGNIVAGIELIRRIEGAEVFGLTFPLVTTSDGKKMGKTEKGAIFLDETITPPYEFFQYWRNVTDADVRKFLLMFTFLDIKQIDNLTAPGKNPNEAKEKLAWEVTNLIHGKDNADRALSGAHAAFTGAGDKSAMPTKELDAAELAAGKTIVDLFFDTGLCSTKSDARRLVEQGGAFVGAGQELTAITDVKAVINDSYIKDSELILRAGKKRYLRIIRK
jgi:tyrosyl-tRNA synthetase